MIKKLVQPAVPTTYGFVKLDNITFGNPTQKCLELINKTSFIEEDVIPLIHKRPFLANSNQKTIYELKRIIESIKANKSKEKIEENLKYDTQTLDVVFSEYCEKNKLKYDKDVFTSVINDILPLIAQIKYYYNRPRPYQLANYYKMPLYPLVSSSSPSYPSAKALISYLFATIVCFKNDISTQKEKEKVENIAKFHSNICHSSINLGTHYPSDMEFSVLISKIIIKNQKFIDKYLK